MRKKGSGFAKGIGSGSTMVTIHPFKDYPLTAMIKIVEYFYDLNAHLIPRACVEQLYPSMCIHACMVEMSLTTQAQLTDKMGYLHNIRCVNEVDGNLLDFDGCEEEK